MKLDQVCRRFAAGFFALACTGAAFASPVEYTLTVPYADVVLGGVSYAYNNYSTRFVFDGDDANVVVSSVPFVAFAAIYQGTAKVEILNGTSVVASATFLPDQIVVSADMSNGGLGFGFVPGGIGASGLDVSQLQPLYPMSITNYGRGSFGYDNNYDLTLAFAAAHAGISYAAPSLWPTGVLPFGADGSADIFGAVFSCNDFSGFIYAPGCGPAAPLQTDAGDFTIGPMLSMQGLFVGDTRMPMVGEFTARALSAEVPEPPSAALLALGLLLAAGFTRTRRLRHRAD